MNPSCDFHVMLEITTVGICMTNGKSHQKLLHTDFQGKHYDNLKIYKNVAQFGVMIT